MGQQASVQKPVEQQQQQQQQQKQQQQQQQLHPPIKHQDDKFAKEAEVSFKRSSEQFTDVTVGVGETVGMNLWNHAKWWGQGVAGIVMFVPMMFYVMARSTKKDEKEDEKKQEVPAGHPDNVSPNFVRESAARQPWGTIQASA
ncbi:hypothetical protein DUNSADRAFT_4980 [Dunaliella salina]|uniref:Uncharacterized protein n=1 Tax=Dunaliella salina TaxID=3046 RepID=A0ABQ7GQX4_DUNSA|nr:hypothetical protein DUNSADRAFT_4980 [Dunaliella salina]|eukprot:KAF5837007.1 hypothetical protein DUNSADRAFT_4980 [Dunaliella salina]